jgi:hypothetical protein
MYLNIKIMVKTKKEIKKEISDIKKELIILSKKFMFDGNLDYYYLSKKLINTLN